MTTLKNDAHTMDSQPRFLMIAGMILAAALFRLVPHPPNFTPVGAMALFGGAAIANRRWAFLLPILPLMLSDILIGFDQSLLFVYSAMLLITLLGRLLQSRRRNPGYIAVASLGASLLFFLVTNFGDWLMSGRYSHTIGELVRCYAMAIPFFGNTVMGDLVFSSVLFGGLAFVESRATANSAASLES